MPKNTYENLRNHYKPDKVEVLFVGESRPQGGTFFTKGIPHFIEKQRKHLMSFLKKIYLLLIGSRIGSAGCMISLKIQ